MALKSIIRSLKKQRNVAETVMEKAQAELASIDRILNAAGGTIRRKRRAMSAAARRKISQAQKARWAKAKA